MRISTRSWKETLPHEERACPIVERRRRDVSDEVEPVVLTRKYAECIDGVTLEGHVVGDRLPLSRRHAGLLIAEGWAEPAVRRTSDPVDCGKQQHDERISTGACDRDALVIPVPLGRNRH